VPIENLPITILQIKNGYKSILTFISVFYNFAF
jgi:hypothetical protein